MSAGSDSEDDSWDSSADDSWDKSSNVADSIASEPVDSSSCGDGIGSDVGDDPPSDIEGFPDLVDSSGSECDVEVEPVDPIDALIEFIKSLLICRTLVSKDFCMLMWFISKCPGMRVKCRKFGVKPNGKNFNRKVQRHVGLYTDVDTYNLSVPGRASDKVGRAIVKEAIYCDHELLEQDVRDNDDLTTRVTSMYHAKEFPDMYYQHPVVTEHGETAGGADCFVL